MKQLILEWGKAKAELEAKQQELLEKLNRTSLNSSSPPSADPLNAEKKAIKSILLETASYEIGSKENTPLAKTVRTCRMLLDVEQALWLFVSLEGVEPTNNAAERAIRPAVIWRRTSFGSQTLAGSTFVSRMLTVVTTLKSQHRNVLEFLASSVKAQREDQPSPSLLPQVPAAD